MPIEDQFDVPFVAALALKEKQIQQNYRPIIAVHKWFARRPGSLFRALVLAEFDDSPLRESYFRPHCLEGRTVADPFMGGGTPLIEANRVGCNVIGADINPMAHWIVREEIEHIDLTQYRSASRKIVAGLRKSVGEFYKTTCSYCGSSEADVKYFLWVKQQSCTGCEATFDLFPGYVLAKDRRHPKHVLVCGRCGQLNEVDDLDSAGACVECRSSLEVAGPAKRSRCACPKCGKDNRYPRAELGAPAHRMFAIEYVCKGCRPSHKGRFFKRPDRLDLNKFHRCADRIASTRFRCVPDDEIQPGDEATRLLRWGYSRYREMFNARQLLGLELSARLVTSVRDERCRRALATNLSDLLRYQNMLCRYDTMALKSLDIFSVHGFPVGLVQCESNLLGIRSDADAQVGSGGWENIIAKYARAKAYCEKPFEVRAGRSRTEVVPVLGEWIGEYRGAGPRRSVRIECTEGASLSLREASVDAIFTDPPYFGNVQYAELMEFCYVWLRKLFADEPAFQRRSLRHPEELTTNATMDRGIEHFAAGLSHVFQKMARALKPGGPLAFTYHHNRLEAYYPLAVAVLDSGLICTATFPCPAEMGGSIHINGTQSSILDTVFVCRHQASAGAIRPQGTASLAKCVEADARNILAAGHRPTTGDVNCILNGQVVRTAIARLAKHWDGGAAVSDRIQLARSEMDALATGLASSELPDSVVERINPDLFRSRVSI